IFSCAGASAPRYAAECGRATPSSWGDAVCRIPTSSVCRPRRSVARSAFHLSWKIAKLVLECCPELQVGAGVHSDRADEFGQIVDIGVGWGDGADRASYDADVSITLPKIPYGGFSPVRLQGQPVRCDLPTRTVRNRERQ